MKDITCTKKWVKNGMRGGGYIFEATVTSKDAPLTPEQAMKLQTDQGLHPAGYNFYDFKYLGELDNVHYYQWKCYGSCD